MSVLADPHTDRPDIAVVRQPIADSRHTVVGYELLFGGDGRPVDAALGTKSTSALPAAPYGAGEGGGAPAVRASL